MHKFKEMSSLLIKWCLYMHYMLYWIQFTIKLLLLFFNFLCHWCSTLLLIWLYKWTSRYRISLQSLLGWLILNKWCSNWYFIRIQCCGKGLHFRRGKYTLQRIIGLVYLHSLWSLVWSTYLHDWTLNRLVVSVLPNWRKFNIIPYGACKMRLLNLGSTVRKYSYNYSWLLWWIRWFIRILYWLMRNSKIWRCNI
jgi:hypothetical protein